MVARSWLSIFPILCADIVIYALDIQQDYFRFDHRTEIMMCLVLVSPPRKPAANLANDPA